MKKILAFLVAVCCMIGAMMPIAYAQEGEFSADSDKLAYETLREHAVTYTCSYQSEQKKIEISGTVNHDVLISHNNFTIEVYRISANQTLSDVLQSEQPLASASIAIKFHFSIATQGIGDRFARYALILRAPSGEVSLAAEPQYAGVRGEEEAIVERTAFKGVSSAETSVGGALGFGTSIVPIELDQLISDVSNGVMYAVDQTQIYFDKTAIDELDAAVRTYSAVGSRVYFQLLLSDRPSSFSILEGTAHRIPNVYDSETMTVICAVSEFLAQRYDDTRSGELDGMIVGKAIDRYEGSLSLEDYAERYALYLTTVANSARVYRPSLDIVIPFSDEDCYTSSSSEAPTVAASLLESVVAHLDRYFCFDFACSTLIESDTTPLGITNESLEQGIDPAQTAPEGQLSVENLQVYSQYLSSLKERYGSAPTHYLYLWLVSDSLSDTAFACAYSYSYYRLYLLPLLSSFVIASSDNRLSEAQRLLGSINTPDGLSMTAQLLPYFDATDWQTVVEGFSSDTLAVRRVYQGNCDRNDASFAGSFAYVEFSKGNIGEWFAGASCKSLKADYDTEGVRGLYSTMRRTEGASHADVFCLYEYPENFVYTPYLKFTLSIAEPSDITDGLYQVVITVGNQTEIVTAEYMVSGKETAQLWIDMRGFNARNMAEYIKISTRALSSSSEEYSLCLNEIRGYSKEHSSDRLADLITAERLRIRNQSEDADEEPDKSGLIWIIFGVLVGVTGIGAGLFMAFSSGREEDVKQSEENDQKKS